VKQTPRTFELILIPDGSDYQVDVVVSSNGGSNRLVHLEGRLVERMRPALLGAVVASKRPRTSLSPTRTSPIRLTEDAGVRLALVALATAPLSKPARIEEIRQGVDAMTSEEALYWYANCTGPSARRALRALRVLLSEE
jgi:hypothetical protein